MVQPSADEAAEKTICDYLRSWGLESYIPNFLDLDTRSRTTVTESTMERAHPEDACYITGTFTHQRNTASCFPLDSGGRVVASQAASCRAYHYFVGIVQLDLFTGKPVLLLPGGVDH